MVMTILEGHVAVEKGKVLEIAYQREVQNLEPAIVQTYLIHSAKDATLWRIMTIWRSRKDLDLMRQEGTPRGVVMFREADAEPELSIYDITAQANQ